MSTKAEAALKTIGAMVVAVVVSTIGTLTYIDGRIERTSARAAQDAVQPVQAALAQHLKEVGQAGAYMQAYADWSSKTIYALCRANRNADCPSPPTWPTAIGGK